MGGVSQLFHSVFDIRLGIGFKILSRGVIFVSIVCAASFVKPDKAGTSLDKHMDKTMLYPAVSGSMMYTWQNRALPICSLQWGGRNTLQKQRLTVMDLVVMTTAMYKGDNASILDFVNQATIGTDLADFRMIELEPFNETCRMGVFQFPSSKINVVAVRGTEISEEIALDLDLFAGIFVFQVFDKLFPLLSVFSERDTQSLVEGMSIRDWFGPPKTLTRVIAKLTEVKANGKAMGYETLVVGHSLGGFVALSAGASAGVQSFGLSPPGQVYVAKRADHDVDDIKWGSAVLVTELDPVPKVDQQVGFVQHMKCASFNPSTCHSPWQSICELYKTCGDARGRRLNPATMKLC